MRVMERARQTVEVPASVLGVLMERAWSRCRDCLAVGVIMALVVVGSILANPPLCPTEDSNACIWVAPLQGDGNGRSFIALPDGSVIYLGDAHATR